MKIKSRKNTSDMVRTTIKHERKEETPHICRACRGRGVVIDEHTHKREVCPFCQGIGEIYG